MVLNCPAWLRIPIPLKSDLRLSTVAIRQLRGPHLCAQKVLRLSWKRTDRQQNPSQRPPAAERGAPRELLTGMMKWEEERTQPKPQERSPRRVAAGHLGRSLVGLRALCKARLALNEVFMCAPVFAFLCWNLITVWGNIQGNAHMPSASISLPRV